MRQPRRVGSNIGRSIFRHDAPDAEASDFETEMFVVVTTGRFAKYLAHPVVAVRPDRNAVIDLRDIGGIVVD